MATLSSILGLENTMDKGAWPAIVHEAAKSQTRLKQCNITFLLANLDLNPTLFCSLLCEL